MTDKTPHCTSNDPTAAELALWIKQAAIEIGFYQASISQPDLGNAKQHYLQWLSQGRHGEMGYMERNLEARFSPAILSPNTISILSVSLPYLSNELNDHWQQQSWDTVADSTKATVSRYALGRDYHKVVRQKLQKLAKQIEEHIQQPLSYRAFSDSAPVPEVEIAQQGRLGWRGKHTLLIHPKAGSMFFLGELYLGLDLPRDPAQSDHCGNCSACITICPTQAITAPYQVDARRCISYLTIEYAGEIPHEFRKAIGNRIYGCDDCQLACPWNKFAIKTDWSDFIPRNQLNDLSLLDALAWTEDQFNTKMAGSAIYRIGHAQWQRNVILAIGNLQSNDTQLIEHHIQALQLFSSHQDHVIREQAQWSVTQLQQHNISI